MKRIAKYIIAATLICIGVATISARSYKRGVSENSFALEAEMNPLAKGVSWYYNWGNTPSLGYQNQVYDYDGMEFAPMCWNGNFSASNIRNYCKAHPGTKYILGFNEPNFTNQANMTPQAAAQKWPELVALAKELNLKIVAPALNYSPNPPYQSPTKWFDEFVALVGADAFDYVAIHGYGGFGVIKDLATEFHNRYGKDVWVTEFCYWPGESGYVSPESQISSMVETVTWLETTEWIHRYAWFKAKGAYNSTNGGNFGLIVSKTGYDERELSEQGKVYCYMSEFDKSRWYAVNDQVNAVDYVNVNGVSLGESADVKCAKPIEISRFNAGAWADYQFEVATAGNYNLMLRVSGEGEPVRFDPQLQVQLVEGEKATSVGNTVKFGLSGDNGKYNNVNIPVSLKAGKQTLRVVDMAPYSPSGIRISSLTLVDAAGLRDVSELANDEIADIYSLSGIKVRSSVNASEALRELPKGIYIVNGKKIQTTK